MPLLETPEHAIAAKWNETADLAHLAPDAKVFIGEPPLLDEAETAEVVPVFVSIASTGLRRIEHTSSGLEIREAGHRITVQAERRDDAIEVARVVNSTFRRPANMAYRYGTILNMKPAAREERQGPDGMWIIAADFVTLYTVTS